MYVGHFSIGIAIKAAQPKIRALPIFVGVGFLDIVDGLLVMTGTDRVAANLHAGPYLFFDLTFIDWDHSLLMAVVLSLMWGAFFLRDKHVAAVAGLACISHLLADIPMHNADLALYPYSRFHIGYGLWGKLPIGSWVVEGIFTVVLVAWAWTRFRARNIAIAWPLLILAALFLCLSPWLSPMKQAAMLEEPAAHLLNGALVTIGFLVPGLLITWLLDRAEAKSQKTRATGR